MVEFGGKRLLIVEDEYLIASALAEFLKVRGADIVGPVGSVRQALALIERTLPDAAVLDVNLGSEQVYPVADVLIDRAVPFVFATGYDQLVMRRPYLRIPRCQKPIDKDALARLLHTAIVEGLQERFRT